MADKPQKRSRFNYITAGIIIGLSLGGVMGSALDIGGMGIGIGLSLGLAFGAILQKIAESRA